MSQFGHSRVAQAFPNTYLGLLPNDLKNLLSDYFYGPLEIMYYYRGRNRSALTVVKYANNKMESRISVALSVFNLFAEYERNPNNGSLLTLDGKTTILWGQKYIVFQYDDIYALPSIYLHDYTAKLFWQKLKIIINALEKNYNLGLDDASIAPIFNNVVF